LYDCAFAIGRGESIMDVEFTFYYLSAGQWLFIAGVCLVSLLPAIRVVRRLGLQPWWSIIMVIPLVNVLALWAIAYVSKGLARRNTGDA
jgi:hypothetical protein